MIDFQNKLIFNISRGFRLIPTTYVLTWFFIFPPTPVSSQQDNPLILKPRSAISVDTQRKPKANVLVAPKGSDNNDKDSQSLQSTTEKEGVQVDKLEAINSDEVGILDTNEGAFGVDMWSGIPAIFVEKLLRKLPITAQSVVMRDLMRRLLLSPAKSPEGGKKGVNLILIRLRALIALGLISEARALLESIPDFSRDPELIRLDVELSLLSYDYVRACNITTREFPQKSGTFWHEIFSFCGYISGGADRAALGISLMREVGNSDERFFRLADALISGEILDLENFSNPSPLHLAMIKEANVNLSFDMITTKEVNILRAVVSNIRVPLGFRLKAADFANSLGGLPSSDLRDFFNSLDFSKEELSNPLSRAEVQFGPRIRALLYHTALKQKIPTAQAEAVSRALALGHYEKRYFPTVRLFETILKNLQPTQELLWFAGEAVRALLVTENFENARAWYKIMKNNAYASNEVTVKIDLFRPIARLFQFSDPNISDALIIQSWLKSANDEKKLKTYLLFNTMEALGLKVRDDAWLMTFNGAPRVGVTLPDLFVWKRLLTIANAEIKNKSIFGKEDLIISNPVTENKSLKGLLTVIEDVNKTNAIHEMKENNSVPHIGEAVLLALVAIGQSGPVNADPIVLGVAIKALISVGLIKEARSLALEALLGNDL